MDGHGENPGAKNNAIESAKTPNLDQIKADYPTTFIEPGGELVGLPKGITGNSEVGHMNLGAGRPVRQDLVVINESIEKDDLKDRAPFKELVSHSLKNRKVIHLLTLLSDGVHSHIDHLLHIHEKIKMKIAISIFLYMHLWTEETPLRMLVKNI